MFRIIVIALLFSLSVAIFITSNSTQIISNNRKSVVMLNSKGKTKIQLNDFNTISFSDYLTSVSEANDRNKVKLDKNGNAVYRGKTILTDAGLPLNDKNAYTTIEIKEMLAIRGVKPRECCDPNDFYKNGSLGCYIVNPDEIE